MKTAAGKVRARIVLNVIWSNIILTALGGRPFITRLRNFGTQRNVTTQVQAGPRMPCGGKMQLKDARGCDRVHLLESSRRGDPCLFQDHSYNVALLNSKGQDNDFSTSLFLKSFGHTCYLLKSYRASSDFFFTGHHCQTGLESIFLSYEEELREMKKNSEKPKAWHHFVEYVFAFKTSEISGMRLISGKPPYYGLMLNYRMAASEERLEPRFAV